MEQETEKKDKEIKISTILSTLVIILIAFILFTAILIYGFNANNAFTQFPVKYLPYPAAIVDHNIISIQELKNRVNAVKSFYENQDFSDIGMRVDFTTPEGQKRLRIKEKSVLEKLIEEEIIQTEANKLGIELTPEMISEEVNAKLSTYGNSEEVKNNLGKLYGWTLEDFQENIVKPGLYQQKLVEKIKATDSKYTEAKEKIAKAQADLNNKRDFETVVTQYSEGDSVKNKGELGWFSQEEMLPEIAEVAFNLKTGTNSDIIESSLGFHIINVEDKETKDGIEKVRIKQIFVRIPTFASWLEEKEKSYSIRIPLKDYQWNKEKVQIEFQNKELRKFEENISTNSPDDVSTIF